MEENGGGGSYRYWVREATADAAPLPLPKKLSPQHLLSQPNSLGSVWNTVPTPILFPSSSPLLSETK
ncbi:hypothetical protein NC652_040346 [Populus alba x Populus x berolinensis]|nr:hypothetical protein NC652_040346 [Populus alba x Populus x berolinensis]